MPIMLLFFFIVDLYFSVPPVIAQIFNPTAEFVITIGMPTIKTKAETKMHSVTAEAERKKCSI